MYFARRAPIVLDCGKIELTKKGSAMNVWERNGNHEVRTADQLNAILLNRHRVDSASVNSFWLSHASRFPCMSIMVTDELATVWYAPKEGHAGYVSSTTIDTLEKGGVTLFDLDGQRQEVGNHMIVKWPEAVQAAREFLESSGLPHSIQWLEL